MKSLHQDLRFIPKPSSYYSSSSSLHLPISLLIPFSSPLKPHQPQSFSSKFLNTHLLNSHKTTSFSHFGATHLKNFLLLTSLSSSFPFPSFAAEIDQVSDKINIESALVSIDDFFNRYPFFVAGCTFIWLVVIPLTEQYLKKYKFISAIDAYRKLRDLPNSQLLDIRKKQSINYLSSPNLKVLNKGVVHIEFVEEEEEEGFAKQVLKRFGDPANTTLCVLDNFDGNSLKVAELLFKNGFKEAYAIKGGLRGKDGWQSIQETLLPPSMHVHPSKKKNKSTIQLETTSERIKEKNSGNGQAPSCSIKQEHKQNSENGCIKPMETSPEAKLANGRPLSPYPKYPNLKPPSSPSPSKPQS